MNSSRSECGLCGLQEQLQNVAATRKLMVLPVSNPLSLEGAMARPGQGGEASHVPRGSEPPFVADVLARIEQMIQAKLW